MDETMREKIALFRYGAISEVVNGPLAPGEKEKLLARLAAKEWTIPGTSPDLLTSGGGDPRRSVVSEDRPSRH